MAGGRGDHDGPHPAPSRGAEFVRTTSHSPPPVLGEPALRLSNSEALQSASSSCVIICEEAVMAPPPAEVQAPSDAVPRLARQIAELSAELAELAREHERQIASWRELVKDPKELERTLPAAELENALKERAAAESPTKRHTKEGDAAHPHPTSVLVENFLRGDHASVEACGVSGSPASSTQPPRPSPQVVSPPRGNFSSTGRTSTGELPREESNEGTGRSLRFSEPPTSEEERRDDGSAKAVYHRSSSIVKGYMSSVASPPQSMQNLGSLESLPSVASKASKAQSPWPPEIRTELKRPPRVLPHASTCLLDLVPHRAGTGTIGMHEFTSNLQGSSRHTVGRFGPQPAFSFRMPLHPNSSIRTCLDCILLVFLCYDAVSLPYFLAFDVPLRDSVLIIAWLEVGFWTLDFMLGFATGYFRAGAQSGDLVMNWRSILVNYLRTWCIPDLAIVTCDWVSLVLLFGASSDQYLMRVARMARVVRTLRVFEVVSLGRYDAIIQQLSAFMDMTGWSERLQVCATILKQFAVVVWTNHLGCCIWYLVGSTGSPGHHTWLDEVMADSISGHFDAAYDFEIYTRGFIWSITTMLGQSPVDGQSLGELCFQAVWLTIGFVFGGLMVSNLADRFWKIQELTKDHTAKRLALRRFLQQQQVDRVLAFAIQREVGERMRQLNRLCDQDVPTLSLLSSALRAELRRSRCENSLLQMPLLRTLQQLSRGFSRGLCARGVSYDFHRPGQEVFQAYKAAEGCYRVVHGTLEYARGIMDMCQDGSRSRQTQDCDTTTQTVGTGAWCAEHALLMKWQHMGDLEAKEMSELVAIRARGFAEMLILSGDLLPLATGYAVSLMKALQEKTCSEVSDIDCAVDHGVVALGMESSCRTRLGEAALQALREAQWWKGFFGADVGLQELAVEIEKGQGTLVFDKSGRVMRVVPLAVMRCIRDDGRLLAQVAKWNMDDQAIVDIGCMLPGTKQTSLETSREALERLIEEELPLTDGKVEWLSQDTAYAEKDSTKYNGLRTLYVKTVEHCDWEAGCVDNDAALCVPKRRKSAQIRARGVRALKSQLYPEAFISRQQDGVGPAKRPVLMWLTLEEFEELLEPRGEQVLRELLADLDFGDGASMHASHSVSSRPGMRDFGSITSMRSMKSSKSRNGPRNVMRGRGSVDTLPGAVRVVPVESAHAALR